MEKADRLSGVAASSEDDDLIACVAAMAAGDEPALERLYESTVGRVYALAQGILRRREDAEEVVCATYAYAWANAASFDARRCSVPGWLLMICRSRAIDQWRRASAEHATVAIDDIDHEPECTARRPDELLELMQESSRLHAALARLEPLRRQLVAHAFLQGLSHEEIAQAAGLPLGTVKSHLRRALQQLRQDLEAP